MKQFIHVAKELSVPILTTLTSAFLFMITDVYACSRMGRTHCQLFNIPISPWTYIILTILSLACLKGALNGFKIGVNLKVRPKNYILPLCALFLAGLSFWVATDMRHSKDFHRTRSLFMDLPVTEDLLIVSLLFFLICSFLAQKEMEEAGIFYSKQKEDNQTPAE